MFLPDKLHPGCTANKLALHAGSVTEFEQEKPRMQKDPKKGSYGAHLAEDASQATYDSRESASAYASSDLPRQWPGKKLI